MYSSVGSRTDEHLLVQTLAPFVYVHVRLHTCVFSLLALVLPCAENVFFLVVIMCLLSCGENVPASLERV